MSLRSSDRRPEPLGWTPLDRLAAIATPETLAVAVRMRAMTAGTLVTASAPKPQLVPRCWRHPDRDCPSRCQALAESECLYEQRAAKKRPQRGKAKQQAPFPKAAVAP